MRSDYCIVFITASGPGEASRIAKALVREKLAACVNSVPAVRSCYWWKNKVETARETLLIIKSKKSKLAALTRKVRSLHSYSVPEVAALPIVGGNPAYLDWIGQSLR